MSLKVFLSLDRSPEPFEKPELNEGNSPPLWSGTLEDGMLTMPNGVGDLIGFPSPYHTPRLIPCRCLKFSTQPELALNLSSEILRFFATSLALDRINESESVVVFEDVNDDNQLTSSVSISGNLDGLQSEVSHEGPGE